ncbi:MAG: hypothetical protein OXH79_16840 [Boseongicola sp.]|nr:hypothetical protein [Boseongicola sp.]
MEIRAQMLAGIAISLSFTPANRPLPRPGERHSEMAPGFSAGSVGRYISVVWSDWRPSHGETLRMSPVASRIVRAQACRLSRARDGRHVELNVVNWM